MKSLISFLLVIMSSVLIAGEQYSVKKVEQTEEKVKISYETNEIKSSICFMTTTKLAVENPEKDIPMNEVLGFGIIDVTSEVLPYTYCLMSFGPHSGHIEFNKGRNLPELERGNAYKLIINGEEQEEVIQINKSI
jgi:hypothetical protein